jgi:hypothetical protein
MKYHLLSAALAALLLAGCTDADWDRTMTFAGVGTGQTADAAAGQAPRVAAAEPTSPAAAAEPRQARDDTGFCRAVAQQDASAERFDMATRQRLFQRSLQQCLALFGDGRALADNSR